MNETAVQGTGSEDRAQVGARDTSAVTGTMKNRILRALGNAMELRIVTVVGTLEITDFDKRGKSLTVNLGNDQRSLFTSINIVTGDIRCAVSPEYEADGNEKMREFHTQQVELGRDIVEKNLRLLADLAGAFADLFDRDPSENQSQ